jgi:hypothetical protein
MSFVLLAANYVAEQLEPLSVELQSIDRRTLGFAGADLEARQWTSICTWRPAVRFIRFSRVSSTSTSYFFWAIPAPSTSDYEHPCQRYGA